MIEPSSGGAGFYSSVFVIPKCTAGVWPILNLKQFNHYLHVASFKMPNIRHVLQCIQNGDYAFSIDIRDAYLHIPNVKHHYHFLQFSGKFCHIRGKFYLWAGHSPYSFHSPH